MAQALVKCGKCGQIFDRNSPDIPNEKIKNRYYHKDCPNELQKRPLSDKEKLEATIKRIFKIKRLTPKFTMQINKYVKEYNYTYIGIEYTIHYFFEIKENSIDKAQGGIGIVPYVYAEAEQHYLAQLAIKKKAEKLGNILDIITPQKIMIKLPKPKPAKNFNEIIDMKEL